MKPNVTREQWLDAGLARFGELGLAGAQGRGDGPARWVAARPAGDFLFRLARKRRSLASVLEASNRANIT